MAETHDLVVIGSGPGGYVAAIRAGQLGLRTAIVEKDDKFGGTCLHWGCIPTKALLFDAEVYDYFKNASEYGIKCQGFSLDWDAVQSRKNKIVTKLAKGVEFLLKKNKVEIIQGYGSLAGGRRVSVTEGEGPGRAGAGKPRELTAKNIVIATGSEAKMIPGLKPDAKTILTNKEILALKNIPKSLVIIGAGAVGVEFASIYHRLGTAVTLIEMLPRLVPLEDEEVAAELERSFRKQGIAVHTGTKVQKAAKTAKGGVSVEFTGPDGKSQTVEAEALLVAVGRAPNTGNVGLEKTRAKLERGFVKVDGYMRTDEPGLYAIGDIVAGSPLLAHVGEMEGIVAVTHAAGREAEPINYRQAPNCTYCEPEISSVGLTERQAREAGHKVKIGKFPFSANSKAAILGVREGFVKIVSDEQYGEILGVHMIGPRVTEMIAEAVVAMRLEGTVEDLAHAIHPHPTLTEAVLEAAHAVADAAIHI
ncbi:MAG TPA: dihydrolipoyl dehydrogenase [Terriglobia bacterium]|nr:dihydrolipoyl dehydrogenase [Terriglobia bacterium]